jgi:hypothetical protein
MNGNITGWTSERYMPKLLAYKTRLDAVPFDFYEVIAALAPRPVFISAPLGDTNFKYRSVDQIVAAAKSVYELFGARARLQLVHPDCPHDLPSEVRDQAYRFMDDFFQQKPVLNTTDHSF